MRPATQKEYLDRIRDDEAENYYKKTGYVPTEWAVMNFIAGFNKGAEEMAKIKDAQIERLVKACDLAVKSWGDYSPEYGNARKALVNMKLALESFRDADSARTK